MKKDYTPQRSEWRAKAIKDPRSGVSCRALHIAGVERDAITSGAAVQFTLI